MISRNTALDDLPKRRTPRIVKFILRKFRNKNSAEVSRNTPMPTNIVDRTVAAVCKFINFAVAFADHTAKLKALAETADTAEKVQKGHGFIHRL